ncbi:MAG: hypothetical protein HQL46_10790 [Gammaproteobacteria bacterium]|nr:hypothetical protein [Gammaproteobacteria bacterium]
MKSRYFLLILFLVSLVQFAFANTFVGFVSEFTGNVTYKDNRGFGTVDYGHEILIDSILQTDINSSVSITYYDSCRSEWFGGNTVIKIGKSKSQKISGKLLKTESFDCDIPLVKLDEKDSFKTAGFRFRGKSTETKKTNTKNNILAKKVKEWGRLNSLANINIWIDGKTENSFKNREKIKIKAQSNIDAYILINFYTDEIIIQFLNNLKAGQTQLLTQKANNMVFNKTLYENSIQFLVSDSPFPSEVLSVTENENSQAYQRKLYKYLSNSQDLSIQEYRLKIEAAD